MRYTFTDQSTESASIHHYVREPPPKKKGVSAKGMTRKTSGLLDLIHHVSKVSTFLPGLSLGGFFGPTITTKKAQLERTLLNQPKKRKPKSEIFGSLHSSTWEEEELENLIGIIGKRNCFVNKGLLSVCFPLRRTTLFGDFSNKKRRILLGLLECIIFSRRRMN